MMDRKIYRKLKRNTHGYKYYVEGVIMDRKISRKMKRNTHGDIKRE